MANFNYNKIELGGRLVVDPQLRTTPNGTSVATFSIAVNRRTAAGKEQVADFFNVVAWRNTADFVSKYFKKGNSCFITGSVYNKKWKDQNGTEHYGIEIVADEVFFVDSKSESSGNINNVDGQAASSHPDLTPLDPDAKLPF